jgi:DNA polymerase III delta prime subunit
MQQDFVWVEKYRPAKVSETILPPKLKQTFQQFVDQGNIPNLILSGRAGIGKTTIAKAMLEELGCDYIVINGSMNGNIDTLRVDIQTFASSVSFAGGRKYVILDEADYLNANSTQPALRNFMEEFSKNCGFILTCNFRNRIIDPLQSRCSVIDFDIPKDEKPKIAAQFFKRATDILTTEGVEFDQKAVAAVVQKHFPDWRRVLNELQRYSATGRIDEGVLVSKGDDAVTELVGHMKQKSFSDARKWVGLNSDLETAVFYRQLFDILPTKVKSPATVAGIIVTLAEYQYKEAFVADLEINRAAAVATLMSEITDWA